MCLRWRVSRAIAPAVSGGCEGLEGNFWRVQTDRRGGCKHLNGEEGHSHRCPTASGCVPRLEFEGACLL